MLEIRLTPVFGKWLGALRDPRAVARIASRIARVRLGHFGDAKMVGSGVGELRIDYGPGYRLYFARQGDAVVVLLCGGDKSSQTRDIKRAEALLTQMKA